MSLEDVFFSVFLGEVEDSCFDFSSFFDLDSDSPFDSESPLEPDSVFDPGSPFEEDAAEGFLA